MIELLPWTGACEVNFLYPSVTEWEAPLTGEPGPPATIPPADVYDLRGRSVPQTGVVAPEPPASGSNNWAVSGAHTATGRALVANDPHLPLGTPSVWFRLSLERAGRRVTGVSIAGLPGVGLGSNGHVAWSATTDNGDWTDFILLDLDPNDPNRYRTPDGWREIETVSSQIEVAGKEPHELAIRRTIWGPVLGELPDGTPYVRRVAQRDDIAFGSVATQQAAAAAEDVSELVMLAPQLIREPTVNLVAGDAEGHIVWTIPGLIPRRLRHDLVSHSSDGPAWDGWLAPDERPLVLDPPQGRIWTANNRVVDGEMLEKIGDGGYVLGARARQIRDRLMPIENATPADMLRIQLDDEALFLVRWRDHFLTLLEGDDDPLHGAVRDAIRNWEGHASADSAGYTLVSSWRPQLIENLATALTAEVKAAYPSWRYRTGRGPWLRRNPPTCFLRGTTRGERSSSPASIRFWQNKTSLPRLSSPSTPGAATTRCASATH